MVSFSNPASSLNLLHPQLPQMTCVTRDSYSAVFVKFPLPCMLPLSFSSAAALCLLLPMLTCFLFRYPVCLDGGATGDGGRLTAQHFPAISSLSSLSSAANSTDSFTNQLRSCRDLPTPMSMSAAPVPICLGLNHSTSITSLAASSVLTVTSGPAHSRSPLVAC